MPKKKKKQLRKNTQPIVKKGHSPVSITEPPSPPKGVRIPSPLPQEEKDFEQALDFLHSQFMFKLLEFLEKGAQKQPPPIDVFMGFMPPKQEKEELDEPTEKRLIAYLNKMRHC